MGVYYCDGCQTKKDDDLCPMAESELCEDCHPTLDGWTIEYNPKPIPSTDIDWDYYHEDCDEENGLSGSTSSYSAAIFAIFDIEEERK